MASVISLACCFLQYASLFLQEGHRESQQEGRGAQAPQQFLQALSPNRDAQERSGSCFLMADGQRRPLGYGDGGYMRHADLHHTPQHLIHGTLQVPCTFAMQAKVSAQPVVTCLFPGLSGTVLFQSEPLPHFWAHSHHRKACSDMNDCKMN